MTEETYQRIVEHVRAHSLPPSQFMPDGIGLTLVEDPDVPVDEPGLERDRLRLHPDDLAALRQRVPRREPRKALA